MPDRGPAGTGDGSPAGPRAPAGGGPPGSAREKTAGEALHAGRALLERAGVPEAPADAAVLLAHVAGGGRAKVWAHPERALAAAEWERYAALLRRRAAGEPTPYLTGVREFWSLAFRVDARVLIPRPETEHLVEVVLARCPRPDPTIADVGTGSGCIGLALAHERPQARVIGIDVSPGALQVAGDNARRLGLERRFHLIRGRGLDPLRAESADVIVSNPPYVAPEDMASLPAEVRDHEPPDALTCGGGGLGVTWQVIAAAERVLVPDGLLALEIDPRRAGTVVARVRSGRWDAVGVQDDLAGRPRVVHAVRRRGRG